MFGNIINWQMNNTYRYMVAKNDLVPGEIILRELPMVVGPCTDCRVQCLGCYKNLEEKDTFVR